MILTNLILSAGIYSQAIALKEWKHEMFIRTEYEITRSYSAGIQINSHREDAIIDGFDVQIFKTIYGRSSEDRFKCKCFLGGGANVEDRRKRVGMGLNPSYKISDSFQLQGTIGYQREFGEWKREEKPDSVIMTWGLGWEF